MIDGYLGKDDGYTGRGTLYGPTASAVGLTHGCIQRSVGKNDMDDAMKLLSADKPTTADSWAIRAIVPVLCRCRKHRLLSSPGMRPLSAHVSIHLCQEHVSKLERPQSRRTDPLLLIYSFQFSSAFRVTTTPSQPLPLDTVACVDHAQTPPSQPQIRRPLPSPPPLWS